MRSDTVLRSKVNMLSQSPSLPSFLPICALPSPGILPTLGLEQGNWLLSEQRGWFAISVPCGLTLINKQTNKNGILAHKLPVFLSSRDDSEESFILTVFPEKFPQKINTPVSN